MQREKKKKKVSTVVTGVTTSHVAIQAKSGQVGEEPLSSHYDGAYDCSDSFPSSIYWYEALRAARLSRGRVPITGSTGAHIPT